MCQPHQVWIFPHFSRALANSPDDNNADTALSLFRSAMVRGEVTEAEYLDLHIDVARHHSLSAAAVGNNQCLSLVAKRIDAPVGVVWSVVRRFDRPQEYKHFIRSCSMSGDGQVRVGSTREVRVISGLPAETSTERLEILDDDRHVISFRIVGGDHRLHNYRSITTLHDRPAERSTVVIESYVVDVPGDSNREDTSLFADTIVRLNLKSLAGISERAAARRLAGIRNLARP